VQKSAATEIYTFSDQDLSQKAAQETIKFQADDQHL
jgi:hypothetical protein